MSGQPFEQKKIRAAHAKEKQQIRKTCNRPNRLNLLTWTVGSVWRSNFLRFFRTVEDEPFEELTILAPPESSFPPLLLRPSLLPKAI
jgi:hypothetical protein